LSSEDVDKNNLLKEAYAFLFGSLESSLQNEKWRNMLCNVEQDRILEISADEKIIANMRIDPGQVGHMIPLFTTRNSPLFHPSGNISS